MNILTLKIKYRHVLKLMMLAILAFQVILINTQTVSANSKNLLLSSGSTIIADVAEKRITSVVNISSTKVIKTQQSQQYNPYSVTLFSSIFLDRDFLIYPGKEEKKVLALV